MSESSPVQSEYEYLDIAPAKLVVLDPNWRYTQFRESEHGAAISQYPTSAIADIKAMPIARYTAERAVMACWCTFPQLVEGIEAMAAWGFTYRTGLLWVKVVPEVEIIDITEIVRSCMNEFFSNPIKASAKLIRSISIKIQFAIRRGIGHWTQSAAEFVLLGVKKDAAGDDPTKRTTWTRQDTPLGFLYGEDRQFWHPIGKHSKKPEGIQDWLEKKFDGPYLEIYATRQREKWQCVGMDLDTIITPAGIRKMTAAEIAAYAAEKAEREAARETKRKAKAEKKAAAEAAAAAKADKASPW